MEKTSNSNVKMYNPFFVWTTLFVILISIFMCNTYSKKYYTMLPVEVISESTAINNVIDNKERIRQIAKNMPNVNDLQNNKKILIKAMGGNSLDNQNNEYLFTEEFNLSQFKIPVEASHKQEIEYRNLQKDAFAWTWIFLILAGVYIYIVSYLLANISHTKGITNSSRFK